MISPEEKYNDPGIFNFNENGFSFNIDKTITEKKWNEIEEINVYKKDLLTVDLICMDIVFGETYITFTEDTIGWYHLVKKLKEIFTHIPKDWDSEIILPPFETSFKTIYKRE